MEFIFKAKSVTERTLPWGTPISWSNSPDRQAPKRTENSVILSSVILHAIQQSRFQKFFRGKNPRTPTSQGAASRRGRGRDREGEGRKEWGREGMRPPPKENPAYATASGEGDTPSPHPILLGAFGASILPPVQWQIFLILCPAWPFDLLILTVFRIQCFSCQTHILILIILRLSVTELRLLNIWSHFRYLKQSRVSRDQ